MKRANFFVTSVITVLVLGTSCKKMDSTYKDFVVPQGITYPGKATDPMVYVGRNRVKISWLRGTDPTVVSAKIFWDNFLDSTEVKIPEQGDTISTIIDDLPEKPYTFIIKTYDGKGNMSVPVELLSGTYGDQYQASLLNRPVSALVLTDSGEIHMEWGSADISNGAIATEVSYTDVDGVQQLARFPIDATASVVQNIKPGTDIEHRTIFIPDSLAIDTFYTDYMHDSLVLLDNSNWQVIDYSTAHPGDENIVEHVIDGDPSTRWHTWVDHSAYPHFVTVDMGIEHTITYFEIFRDQGDDRACDTFQLLVSTDNVQWIDLGTFNFNRLIDDGQFYEIPSHPKARYWKFVGLSGPQQYMVTGEISVYGK